MENTNNNNSLSLKTEITEKKVNDLKKRHIQNFSSLLNKPDEPQSIISNLSTYIFYDEKYFDERKLSKEIMSMELGEIPKASSKVENKNDNLDNSLSLNQSFTLNTSVLPDNVKSERSNINSL